MARSYTLLSFVATFGHLIPDPPSRSSPLAFIQPRRLERRFFLRTVSWRGYRPIHLSTRFSRACQIFLIIIMSLIVTSYINIFNEYSIMMLL